MTRCPNCKAGISSTYVRGPRRLFTKFGYFCKKCNSVYTLDKKVYTLLNINGQIEKGQNEALRPFLGSLGRDLDPGPLPYQGNALPG
jgi:hypothetical protein